MNNCESQNTEHAVTCSLWLYKHFLAAFILPDLSPAPLDSCSPKSPFKATQACKPLLVLHSIFHLPSPLPCTRELAIGFYGDLHIIYLFISTKQG